MDVNRRHLMGVSAAGVAGALAMSPDAARQRKGAAQRVTLEELVDAGEAMLLEMVRLARQGALAND